MSKQMLTPYKNHVSLVIDESGSMSPLRNTVVDVFDAELNSLQRLSKELGQETRISIYLFGGQDVNCLLFDTDVLRFSSLKDYYSPMGGTPLLDAVGLAVQDNKKLPEVYGDHSYVVYVITDGEENTSSRFNRDAISRLLSSLPQENWTLAGLVPDQKGRMWLEKFGFPKDSISIWDTSEAGVKKAAKDFGSSMEGFLRGRSSGIRATKRFFKPLSTENVNVHSLEKVDKRRVKVFFNKAKDAVEIRPFVEKQGLSYALGNAFYQLVKKEKIQAGKSLVIKEKTGANLYSGPEARKMLGLLGEQDVMPDMNARYDIFVQSTSVNRKIIPEQGVLVFV